MELVGYVIVNLWNVGRVHGFGPQPTMIRCMVATGERCTNERGQNSDYCYVAEKQGMQTNHPTLLRAVRWLKGHRKANLTFLNMACCHNPKGYCGCHGLGVSL